MRQGATSGDPKGRYVANLGHLDDDESGLTYMRARYYEASSGRFFSEDPARDWINFYTYGMNNPLTFADSNGKTADDVAGLIAFLAGAGALFAGLIASMRTCPESFILGASGLAFLAAWFGGIRWGVAEKGSGAGYFYGSLTLTTIGGWSLCVSAGWLAAARASDLISAGPASRARSIATTYGLILLLFLGLESIVNGWG